MICRYCKNEISDRAKFCPHCGNVVEEMRVPVVAATVEQTEFCDKLNNKKKDKKKKGRSKKLIGILSFVLAVISALVFVLSCCCVVISFINLNNCRDDVRLSHTWYSVEGVELAKTEMLFSVKDVEDALESDDYDIVYNSTGQIDIAVEKCRLYDEKLDAEEAEIREIIKKYGLSVHVDPHSSHELDTDYYYKYREIVLAKWDNTDSYDHVSELAKLLYERDVDHLGRTDFESWQEDDDTFENEKLLITKELYWRIVKAEKLIRNYLIAFFISGILAVVFYIIGRKYLGKNKAAKQMKTA